LTAVVAATVTLSRVSYASGVDPALQGAILGKALSYDKTRKAPSLEGKPPPKPNLLVVAAAGDANAAKVAAAFENADVSVRVVSQLSADAAAASWADAVYVFPKQLTSAIQALCITHRLLSMSGDVSDVEGGRASVAIGITEGKPQIVINRKRVTDEGHKLSARLLKLARIV
jgi:predicted porin